MTIELSTTDRRDGKALALFARWQDWQQGHTKDGRPFFAIPGSEPGLLHMADQNDCSCQDRSSRGTICKHMRAVRFWMAAYQTGQVRPRGRTNDPADDLVILTEAGAALLAEQRADDLASEAETDLAFAETATRLRGNGAGALLMTYEQAFASVEA